MTTQRSTGTNQIDVFSGGAAGSWTPIRVISGPHAGLGLSPDTVAVSYSPFTGPLYAAVSAGGSTGTVTHISVFAGDAIGDAAPIRTITGSKTGLTGHVVTGITDSQTSGDIYVMVKAAQFSGPGHVAVFGRLAQGNVTPLRTFSDATTDLADAAGIDIVKQ